MSGNFSGTLLRVVLVAVLMTVTIGSLQVLDAHPDVQERNEHLYFPSGKFLKETTLGYRAVTADYLWFRFIQYYGAFAKDQNDLRYMDVLIESIITLDPMFIEAYHFAALVKWSDFGDFPAAIDMLKRGVLANPSSAKLHFQVGFIYYVFDRDFPRAALWFEMAGQCPDATDVERRFAAFARYRSGDDRVSLELWKTMYLSTDSPQMKDLALKMIQKLERKLELIELYGPGFIGPIPEI
jgi:hypothetical protein|nr:hypothetical protein [Candidatus Krumholzibacteria bacterium]